MQFTVKMKDAQPGDYLVDFVSRPDSIPPKVVWDLIRSHLVIPRDACLVKVSLEVVMSMTQPMPGESPEVCEEDGGDVSTDDLIGSNSRVRTP